MKIPGCPSMELPGKMAYTAVSWLENIENIPLENSRPGAAFFRPFCRGRENGEHSFLGKAAFFFHKKARQVAGPSLAFSFLFVSVYIFCDTPFFSPASSLRFCGCSRLYILLYSRILSDWYLPSSLLIALLTMELATLIVVPSSSPISRS